MHMRRNRHDYLMLVARRIGNRAASRPLRSSCDKLAVARISRRRHFDSLRELMLRVRKTRNEYISE